MTADQKCCQGQLVGFPALPVKAAHLQHFVVVCDLQTNAELCACLSTVSDELSNVAGKEYDG